MILLSMIAVIISLVTIVIAVISEDSYLPIYFGIFILCLVVFVINVIIGI